MKYAVRTVNDCNALGIIEAQSLEQAVRRATKQWDIDEADLIVIENPMGEGRIHIGKHDWSQADR